MEIKNCMSFVDLMFAVVNYGGSVIAAANRAQKVKKCSARRMVDGKSEYRYCLENYPQYADIIDKIAGAN